MTDKMSRLEKRVISRLLRATPQRKDPAWIYRRTPRYHRYLKRFKMAIVVVQHKSAVATATTNGVAFTSSPQANNLLICVNGTSDSKTISAPTDTILNTWNLAINQKVASTGQISIYWAVNTTTSADTVTTHINLSDDNHNHIREISGCATTSPLDQTGVGTGTAATQTVSTTNPTTTANEYCVAAFYDNNHATGYTVIAPYTNQESTAGGGGDAMGSEDNIVSATGTQTATMTDNFGSTNYVSAIATFIIASSSAVVSGTYRTAGPSYAI